MKNLSSELLNKFEGLYKKGYYIMNDNFFNDFFFEVIIDKKYMTDKQLEILNQNSSLFGITEPF